MKKQIKKPITYQYLALIEFDDYKVLITLVEKHKWMFGLFNYHKAVGDLLAFTLIFDQPIEKTPNWVTENERVYFGGVATTAFYAPIYAPSFDLNKEVDQLYTSYLEFLREAENKQKQIDNFINSI